MSADAASKNAAQLAATLESLRKNPHYRNYLRARDAMLNCLSEMDSADATPSAYWREELGGFDYMLDASPLIIEKLREHCHHITGDASYRYRNHHAIVAEPFVHKLSRLTKLDKSDLFVPESPILGGFGHPIDGKLVNVDALKFYECLIALDRAGYLEAVKKDPAHKEVWLEIGAGWGGFGHAVKTRFPGVTYVMVDLPQTMIFSATYLMSAFPDAKIALYPEVPADEIAANLRDYDFVFLPHYVFPEIELDLDLAINMVSFQEMTTEQVAGYVRNLARMGTRRLYSLNRDRSNYNSELTAVTDIIAENFADTRRINILPYSYPTLMPPKVPPQQARLRHLIMQRLFGVAPPAAKPKKEALRPHEYRHLVAERQS